MSIEQSAQILEGFEELRLRRKKADADIEAWAAPRSLVAGWESDLARQAAGRELQSHAGANRCE